MSKSKFEKDIKKKEKKLDKDFDKLVLKYNKSQKLINSIQNNIFEDKQTDKDLFNLKTRLNQRQFDTSSIQSIRGSTHADKLEELKQTLQLKEDEIFQNKNPFLEENKINDNFDYYQQQIDILKHNLLDKEQLITNFQSDYQNLNKTFQELKKRSEILQKNEIEQNDVIKLLNKKQDQKSGKIKNYELQINNLLNENEVLKFKINQLNQNQDQLYQKMEECEQSTYKLSSDQIQIENTKKQDEILLKQLKFDLSKAKEVISFLENKDQKQVLKISQLEQSFNQQQKLNNISTEGYTTPKFKMDDFKSDIQRLIQEKSELSDQLSQIKEEIQNHINGKQQLTSQLENYKEEINNRQQQLLKSQQLNSELQIKKDEEIKNKLLITNQIENLNKEIEKLQNQNQQLEARNQNYEYILKEKDHEIINQKQLVTNLKDNEKEIKSYVYKLEEKFQQQEIHLIQLKREEKALNQDFNLQFDNLQQENQQFLNSINQSKQKLELQDKDLQYILNKYKKSKMFKKNLENQNQELQMEIQHLKNEQQIRFIEYQKDAEQQMQKKQYKKQLFDDMDNMIQKHKSIGRFN